MGLPFFIGKGADLNENAYIYALDISLNSTGLCVFTNDGKLVEMTTIDTHKEGNTQLKLKLIGDTLLEFKKKYPPNTVAIEQGFTKYNKSTQQIFRVHGVVNYIFYDCEQIYYPATTVKKAVSGRGDISKKELQKLILEKNKNLKFRNNDESDAYSVGMTHFLKRRADDNKKNLY